MNLLEIFKDMPEYVIIKIRGDTFPKYRSRQDVDIVCRDIYAVVVYLNEYFQGHQDVRKSLKSENHLHYDCLYPSGKLELRFDLYSKFISPKFTEDTLDQKMLVKYGDHEVWEASYHQDILIKSWEYHTHRKKKYKKYKDFKEGLDAYKDR